MEKNSEQRVAIKFCFKAGKNVTETFEMLKVAYGRSVMSRTNVFRWYSQISSGKESIEDEERSDRPCTTKTDDNIARVAAVLKDHRNGSCRLVQELNTRIARVRPNLWSNLVFFFCCMTMHRLTLQHSTPSFWPKKWFRS